MKREREWVWFGFGFGLGSGSGLDRLSFWMIIRSSALNYILWCLSPTSAPLLRYSIQARECSPAQSIIKVMHDA